MIEDDLLNGVGDSMPSAKVWANNWLITRGFAAGRLKFNGRVGTGLMIGFAGGAARGFSWILSSKASIFILVAGSIPFDRVRFKRVER